MRGTMRTLFLLIVIIQACCAIRAVPRQSEGSGDDDCIERVVMTKEASAKWVQLIYSQMIPDRNQLEQITLINCQQSIIGRIRWRAPVPPSSTGDLHADDVHEVQDNQGFITIYISEVAWSLSDKKDSTDFYRIIFTTCYYCYYVTKCLVQRDCTNFFLTVPQGSRAGTPLEISKTIYKTYCRTFFVTLYLIDVVKYCVYSYRAI